MSDTLGGVSFVDSRWDIEENMKRKVYLSSEKIMKKMKTLSRSYAELSGNRDGFS
jgi:hypothetical protein